MYNYWVCFRRTMYNTHACILNKTIAHYYSWVYYSRIDNHTHPATICTLKEISSICGHANHAICGQTNSRRSLVGGDHTVFLSFFVSLSSLSPWHLAYIIHVRCDSPRQICSVGSPQYSESVSAYVERVRVRLREELCHSEKRLQISVVIARELHGVN
jgi:hypothetical protein